MGSTQVGEQPVHRVTLSPYFIDSTEVTVEAYRACVTAGRCEAPATGRYYNWGRSGRARHPVNGVSWSDALAYCRWAGKRLPTEAEWEYAARGGDGRTFPWGNQPPSDELLRWSGGCGRDACVGGTSAVGSHPGGASAFGVHDMSGNVSEWVSDWFGAYPSEGSVDPSGPATGTNRVLRGGPWSWFFTQSARSTYRREGAGRGVHYNEGFRCARGPVECAVGFVPYRDGCESAAAAAERRRQGEVAAAERRRQAALTEAMSRRAPPGMVPIPGGTFEMGSAGTRSVTEQPVHRVTLSPYYIDRAEVTVEAYAVCVSAGRCDTPTAGRYYNWGRSGTATHPVNGVSWDDASAYCDWAGKRLPTEAEWEYAARGADGRIYPWGNELPSDGWVPWSDGCRRLRCAGGTSAVGSHAADLSAFGVQDMGGNVSEWVSDWSGAYSSEAVVDPPGPATGTLRVRRGGSWWSNSARDARLADRRWSSSSHDAYTYGFRCARGLVCDPGFVRHGDRCEPVAEAAERQRQADEAAAAQRQAAAALLDALRSRAPAGMVAIPGGSFEMGLMSDSEDEQPLHRVTLSSYFMDRTEVTVEAYAGCVSAGRCVGSHPSYSTSDCNYGVSGKERHPMNCVSWDDAFAYCAWVGKRLPTEAEWEYAARGRDGRRYPWGSEAPSDELLHWSAECGRDGCIGGTSVVGTHPRGASAFGLQDLSGNVSEWVSDWYGVYPSGAVVDPTGPATGTVRVLRGGSWNIRLVSAVRATGRSMHMPSAPNKAYGFRCARGAN